MTTGADDEDGDEHDWELVEHVDQPQSLEELCRRALRHQEDHDNDREEEATDVSGSRSKHPVRAENNDEQEEEEEDEDEDEESRPDVFKANTMSWVLGYSESRSILVSLVGGFLGYVVASKISSGSLRAPQGGLALMASECDYAFPVSAITKGLCLL